MEVHHHSNTARKKWSHYFWEFLMLFLAVFCGFLAEYQLEHVIENRREVEYIKSFIEDLKLDTADLNLSIDIRSRRIRSCDSLIVLLKSPDRNQNTNDIYYHGLIITRNNRLSYNDRTIQQLKNSGGMRLIRVKGASDSILNYDRGIDHIRNNEEFGIQILNEYRAIAGSVFDASVFQSMIDERQISRIKRPQGNPKLLTEDVETINRICTQAHFYRRENYIIIINQSNLINEAIRLTAFLKNKYHLK
jgi:hypothetical protein